MKKYKYLLFDADNTLLDFTKSEYIAFRDTASDIGFSEELYRLYSDINDSLWKRLERREITLDFLKLERFRLLLVAIGAPDDAQTAAKAAEMRDGYIKSLAAQPWLVNGAEELCRTLSSEYKLYIITNGISEIQRSRIAISGIGKYFTDIFISEEMGVAKPSAGYFDRVLDTVGDFDRAAYLVIGDSLTSDCDGAIAYGIDVCRYNPENLPANGRKLTYNITELSSLAKIL